MNTIQSYNDQAREKHSLHTMTILQSIYGLNVFHTWQIRQLTLNS